MTESFYTEKPRWERMGEHSLFSNSWGKCICVLMYKRYKEIRNTTYKCVQTRAVMIAMRCLLSEVMYTVWMLRDSEPAL